MGYVTATVTVTAWLSDHNDERDARDRELWEKFQQRLRAITEEPEFRELRLFA